MRNSFFILFLGLALSYSCQAQIPANKPSCEDKIFDEAVTNLLSYTVPLKSVDELSKENLDDYLILDAREKEEYTVSHIKGAKYIGYNNFDIESLEGTDKNRAIVVYCSVGYRSEKIGEKLQKAGFTNVYNLYGSIFEWVNDGHEIQDSSGKSTKKIHTYNKKWSKWVFNEKYTKVW